jgi:hypothetical protein
VSAANRPALNGQARRLRAPLLLALWALLAVEAAGGLVIFFARLVVGTTPGATLHVLAGLALVLAYAVYQWTHWSRIAPWRPRLDYTLGLVAAGSMVLALATGLPLALEWWRAGAAAAGVPYTAWLSGAHNVMSMFVLTFVAAHLFAVLQRTARGK